MACSRGSCVRRCTGPGHPTDACSCGQALGSTSHGEWLSLVDGAASAPGQGLNMSLDHHLSSVCSLISHYASVLKAAPHPFTTGGTSKSKCFPDSRLLTLLSSSCLGAWFISHHFDTSAAHLPPLCLHTFCPVKPVLLWQNFCVSVSLHSQPIHWECKLRASSEC